MTRITTLLTGCALALFAAPCFAQTVELCASKEAKRGADNAAFAANFSEEQVSAAPVGASVSRPNGVEITTTADGGVASLRIGGALATNIHCDGDYQVARTGVWSVTVSAPLNEGASSDGKLANLDGLGNSMAGEFGYRRLIVRARADVDTTKLEELCDDAWKNTAAGKAGTQRADGECDEGQVEDWDKRVLPTFRKELWGENPSAKVWGVSGKVGQEGFEYYDPATLAKLSDHKTGWSAKLYYAYKPLFQNRLFTFQYEHQRAWEGQEDKILCPVGGPTSACVKGAPGKPKGVDKDLFSVDFRQRDNDKAFSVTLTYDAANEVAAIGLPIYLTSEDKSGLVGGIRFDWRSDTNESTVAIFMAKPLDFNLP